MSQLPELAPAARHRAQPGSSPKTQRTMFAAQKVPIPGQVRVTLNISSRPSDWHSRLWMAAANPAWGRAWHEALDGSGCEAGHCIDTAPAVGLPLGAGAAPHCVVGHGAAVLLCQLPTDASQGQGQGGISKFASASKRANMNIETSWSRAAGGDIQAGARQSGTERGARWRGAKCAGEGGKT